MLILAGRLTSMNWPANNLPMTKDDAIAEFGTQVKLALALGISQGSVSLWGAHPPELRQLQIEALTGGRLKAEPNCDKYRVAAPCIDAWLKKQNRKSRPDKELKARIGERDRFF